MLRQIVFPILLAFLIPTQIKLWACTCSGSASPCAAYRDASAVFIGSVKAVQPPIAEREDEEIFTEQAATMRIERMFKGPKLEEITLHQPAHNCAPKFRPGERWLLYAHYHQKTRTWEVFGCGRSTQLDDSGDAADDLLFLNGLPDSASMTRVSGMLTHYEDDPEKGFSVVRRISGARVWIRGSEGTHELYTDRNGVYEIYGLLPGLYTIDPELPTGFKVRFDMPFGPFDRTSEGKVQLEVDAPSCAGVDFILSSATQIRGRVLGPDGQPLARVCVAAIPADKPAGRYFRKFDCTDEEGWYQIDELPPGKYFLVTNKEGRITGREPFSTTYYPGVLERKDASVVTLLHGEQLAQHDIRIPMRVRTFEIEGLLVYSDGRPAAKERVSFRSATDARTSEADTVTDKAGRFRVQVLEGRVGWLSGEMYIYSSKFTACPEIDKLLASSPAQDFQKVSTPPIKLQVRADIRGIELRFPFPFCELAKQR